MARKTLNPGGTVAVIGLGRFGTAVATRLQQLEYEVLGIDENPQLVQRLSDQITHVFAADSTDEATLRQLGLQDLRHAVVAIGTDIEASVLTVVALAELGIANIWAKAITAKHGAILRRVGAHHVVYPEAAMGKHVAHLVIGGMVDYIELGDDYAIGVTSPPTDAIGKPLAELQAIAKHGVTVMGIKLPGTKIRAASESAVLGEDDLLIITGRADAVDRFSRLA